MGRLLLRHVDMPVWGPLSPPLSAHLRGIAGGSRRSGLCTPDPLRRSTGTAPCSRVLAQSVRSEAQRSSPNIEGQHGMPETLANCGDVVEFRFNV